MKEKVKNIIVRPNKDYVIWSEDLENIVRETTLNVEAGCTAFYIVNGNIKTINTPGRWVIKSKEEEKSQSSLQLICANTDKTFDVCCGVGNIPFKDFDLNIETTVGAHGECKIRINNPWILYTTFAHANITADEIDSYVKLKLAEIMTSRLSEVLQNYDYNNVMTQQSVIAKHLQEKFSNELNNIGVEVVSFALAGIKFSDSYQEQRKEAFDAQNRKKIEKEERRDRERAQRAEIDNIIAITNATAGLKTNVEAPVKANDTNKAVKYCPRCGMKLDASAVFCSGCGKKLQ